MSVVCQCSSCKVEYQVGDEFAGRTIECPECSAAVVVPAVDLSFRMQPLRFPRPRPGSPKRRFSSTSSKIDLTKGRAVNPIAEPASKVSKVVKAVAIAPMNTAKNEVADAVSPADGRARIPGQGGEPGRIAAEGRPSRRQSPADDEPAVAVAGDGVAIPGVNTRSSKRGFRCTTEKKGVPAWLIATLAATATAVVVGIVYLASLSGSSSTPIDKNVAKLAKAEPKDPLLTIKWPENQRIGATLLMNEVKKEIPATGPIQIPLPASIAPYRFRLQLPGYHEQTFVRASEKEIDDFTVHPWERKSRASATGSRTSTRRRRRRQSSTRMFSSSSTPPMPRRAVPRPAASRKRSPCARNSASGPTRSMSASISTIPRRPRRRKSVRTPTAIRSSPSSSASRSFPRWSSPIRKAGPSASWKTTRSTASTPFWN